MLRNRLYYRLKPLVSRPLRLAVRGWWARRKRERVMDTWPIMPGSERPPEGWPGWPDGKQFALVLTHDVEGQAGLDKCRKLMELEMKLGFRSCFNFVPQGEYRVSREFRGELVANGFEVGVHDLYHDGKLFLSPQEFTRNAPGINRHLADWGAVGFRSGFMLHNPYWLHALNIKYDASTFDTDPFEPQPHGQHTIFPFWIPRPAVADAKVRSFSSSEGYAELPYTLAQDSTLFLLMRERHPDIWFQKLDYIAEHGGMALVNVHPDYMRFGDEAPSPTTYLVEYYSRFLDYVRDEYKGAFWQPLPKEVAAWVSKHKPVARAPRRICMVTYSSFLSDARVKRYAEALAERGDHVDVITLRRSKDEPTRETVNGVNLFRLQYRLGKNEKKKLSFLFPVLRFMAIASIHITRWHARKAYDLLHIHNVPDFLVFAAWYPKLRGAKIILDIHDILPEFYESKFGSKDRSWSMWALRRAEHASARFADHVIISNHLWKDKYATRTGLNGNCSVFINNVDTQTFKPRPRTRNDGKLIVLFPGGLQWHQGLDIAIRAFQKVRSEFPIAELHIYGEGNMKASLVKLAADLNLENVVRFFPPVSLCDVAQLMANADLGVVPKRADSFGNEAYSTKIMEFMSLGIPVVASSTKIDRYYFDDSVLRFFGSGDPDAMATAMLNVLRDGDLRRRLVNSASGYAAQHSWDSRKGDYLRLVDSLIEA